MLLSFAFRSADLPAFGAAVRMAMLFVPLLLFHLRVPIVRTLEKLWFAVLILFLAIAWSFWAADYCNRIAEDRITPATVGVAVLITIATIMFSAMPRWKNGQCLTGHSLHPTILMIALQLLFFGIISTAIGFAALKMALGGRKATMGIPDWFGYIIPLVPLLIQIVFSLSARKLITRFYDELGEGSQMDASNTDDP